MTRLTLTKHHGLGNDFLVVFDVAVPDADLPALARPPVPPHAAASAPTAC